MNARTTVARLKIAVAVVVLAFLVAPGCRGTAASPLDAAWGAAPLKNVAVPPPETRPRDANRMLDDLEHRTFLWFWDKTNPSNGLVPDREPTPSFSSVAAIGFGLTAYTIGAERAWVTREAAAARARLTLDFLAGLPQGPDATGTAGYKGFFYHFVDMQTGLRFENVELSTIDTTLLMAGALACREYFDRDTPDESAVRAQAEFLYRRVEWSWAQPNYPRISMGWRPGEGFLNFDWHGYDEATILYVLALGSPTFPVQPDAWDAYTSTYKWLDYYGNEHVNFAPLFGHQYSHVWIDFRGIRDAYMRDKGIDYFENSRRATLAQRAYAIDNPNGWKGYGERVWGLSACDGPLDATLSVNGTPRRFFTYAARGAAATEVRDDGTIAPTAAIGSIAFAPEVVIPAIAEMKARYGPWAFGPYGFVDAFNPTFEFASPPVQHGRVVAGHGWYDTDRLGIDQGAIVTMIENHRSGLVWRVMRNNPWVAQGLRRAGFTGGWLDAAPR